MSSRYSRLKNWIGRW